MLDGRVLGASQAEYKPFGKPPLKREACHLAHKTGAGPVWRHSLQVGPCGCRPGG